MPSKPIPALSSPSSPPPRLPRAAKRKPTRATIASFPAVRWIPNYPGKRPEHEVGRGPSSHLGAGMGIIALTPLKYGTHGTRWQDNIFCQYVGRVLPLTTAEREDYRSDYLLGWPQHGEAVDGQLENKGSIGHLINDDFTRDGGSLEAHRDSRTGKSYLCLTEDLNPGDEPSFPYGIDFWTAHLMQLPSLSRRSCIQKYRIPLRTLTALGLDPNGFETAAHDVQASAPAQESSTGLLRQTSLDNWRLRATFPHPDNGIECKATLKPPINTILTCELPLTVTTATQAAAPDPETLGLGTVWRRSLGRGELVHEGTLRSEDDSRMRTHTILAEFPPPPPATRHTESKSTALWDKGLLSVSVKSAQESPHEGDQLGMGDLANEEALCRLDDSLLRTHPMLAVPPPPLPASPTVNSLVPDAPLPMIHSNPGESQVNERGSGRFGYWWAGSLPYDSAGSMEGPA